MEEDNLYEVSEENTTSKHNKKYPNIAHPHPKKILVLGIQGSGKTYHSKEIIKKNNLKALVYAPHKHDFANEPNENFILYKYEDFYKEIEDYAEIGIKLGKTKKIDVLFIDEFDMLFKTNLHMGKHFTDLIANHRHYNLGIIGITRRPQDIPAKFYGQCHIITAFSLESSHAIKRLNEHYPTFGDMVRKLKYKSYKGVTKEIGEPPYEI